MQNSQSQTKKQRTLPQNLRQKLKQLTIKLPQEKAKQIDENTYLLVDCPQAHIQIGTLFDMTFKTFVKFLQMIGCKVRQQKTLEQIGSQKIYKIFLPTQRPQLSNNLLQQMMKNSHHKQEGNQNFDQLSIQVNMHRPELQLMNLEHQNQLKDIFLKNFKNNIDCTNQFVDSVVYQILVSRGSKKMSICQVIQLLTELRDRLFDNQKQLQEYIQNFQQKIKSFGHQQTHEPALSEGSNKQMQKQNRQLIKNQMEEQSPINNRNQNA